MKKRREIIVDNFAGGGGASTGIEMVHEESLNWESYENMSELDKMYWDQELWFENHPKNL
ncbi:hypothetical protein GCM10011573_34450 [Enterococcus wangshanyuanii]|uniref:DNA (cytosine-5-)-methyltransferase n=2 Tax=Enterococcus wangshanyuanii TaxID=2005703 RepID=A0ABQ1PS49_9ENTE|nr:hypothetical protein GCM10011573_34450 [Enterococcus wangshanyuanii]